MEYPRPGSVINLHKQQHRGAKQNRDRRATLHDIIIDFNSIQKLDYSKRAGGAKL